MTVVYGLYEYKRDGTPVNPDVNTLYISVTKFAWSVGLAWLTVACITGYGGKHCVVLIIKGKDES